MKRTLYILSFLLAFGLFSESVNAQRKKKKKDEKPKSSMESGTFSALKFRSIGPAFASGRIADITVNPLNHSEIYLAVASGNVWKSSNAGISWKPIFDSYGSYSTSSIAIDPNNTNRLWLGTGEYNSQRAIGYGDGVYRSEDGGKTWKNMGLPKSEHIGRIVIDPRNSHVYVAVQGALWGANKERGLYKSTDNGASWQKILHVSENTGITDVVFNPRNPDVLYAAAYQRRRHVWTLINGGEESAIYKSTDAGKTWNKLAGGLPSGDVGRIGLTISPVNPDYVYAIIELPNSTGGIYRSTNRGASWDKMSGYVASSPQYYNRLTADPKDPNKIYSTDTYSRVSIDGGKTFKTLGLSKKHVDDHTIWIDPDNTNHLLIGGDGGLYESYDMGKQWRHTRNLPITQFYRVSVDNDLPFYNVYGGTQDNHSFGGASQTTRDIGIINEDWYVTKGGDGFKTQIDPQNPDIVYSQSQYGWLVRYDRKSGEKIGIKPVEPAGEAYRWNWNSPLIISPHLHTRLYFAANKLFKSDDRGNSWQVISPDLTRQLDRNKLKVMGKIQPADAVAKNASTSLYGNIVALTESPVKEGLIYVGTDDGLLQFTEDTGKNWTKYTNFNGVPEMTYVSCLLASQHDENTVYASFDNRKRSDFKPYLLKSTDKGKTWQSIASNLPKNGSVFTIAEDHVDKNLLFVGTEFGVFFTTDAGKKWIQLKSGIPTIPVKDIAIQRRENDLALATFGRGFYILNNYSPLRQLNEEKLKQKFILFPVKDALLYLPTASKYGQGATYYVAKNPAFGATFTYFLKDGTKNRKQKRKEKEKDANYYPSWEELQAELDEEKPYLAFVISDEAGNEVRRLYAAAEKGLKRLNWDLRYAVARSVNVKKGLFKNEGSNILVLPGKYKVRVELFDGKKLSLLEGEQEFQVKTLDNRTLAVKDRQALVAYQKQVNELGRVVSGSQKAAQGLQKRLKQIRRVVELSDKLPKEMLTKIRNYQLALKNILRQINGNEVVRKRSGNQTPSINDRLDLLLYSHWASTSAPTQTMLNNYKVVEQEFEGIYNRIKQLYTIEIPALESELEKVSAPNTQGRFPVWKK